MESCQKAKPPFFALNIQPKSGQRGATTFLPPSATETQKCCQQAANSSELEPHPCLALCHSALTASQSFLIHAALRSNSIHNIIPCNNI